MKNLIYKSLLAAIIALPATTFASELSLGSASNLKFTLNLDNAFYATPSNTYNVTNLMPGNHHLRMMSAPSNIYGAYSMPQLLFDGWVTVPQNARVTAMAMNYSQLNIVSVVPLMQQNYNPYDPYGYNNGYGNGNGYNNGYGNGNGNGCGNGNNNGYGYGNGYGNPSGYQNPNYGYGNYPPQYYGMSSVDFNSLKNSVNAQSFDSSKLAIAKQGIASNNLTAAQVKELVGLFTFESSKLEIAKAAYGRTIDKNNFYQVNDAFTFSSSVDELSEYINTYHG
jgi:hypothetical protein